MYNFNIRIDVTNSKNEHQDIVKAVLLKNGFSNVIKDPVNGKTYKLPMSEYIFTSTMNARDVLNHVTTLITSAGLRESEYSLLITQSGGRSWRGLDTID